LVAVALVGFVGLVAEVEDVGVIILDPPFGFESLIYLPSLSILSLSSS